jgi:hypothetical protein
MTEPQRPLNTFHAFCSLLLPGLGQMCQKRPGAAIAFFLLFLLTALMPIIIVSNLLMDRFSGEPLGIHIFHVLVFGAVCIPMMLAFFCAIVDAIAWKPGDSTRFKPHMIVGGILFFGVVVILLLPAVPSAREAARRMQCSNQMRQIVIAFDVYHDKYGHFPPAYTVDEGGKPLHSWRVLILPYIEQNTLYEKIRKDEPWDSEYNKQFHSEVPSIFRCPSVPRRDSGFQCRNCHQKFIVLSGGCYYSVIVGEEAAFNGSQKRTLDNITSGTSNTIFLVERMTPVNWMDPTQEITYETAYKGININATGIGSFHLGGVNVGFGDTTCHFINDDVDGRLLRTLLDRRYAAHMCTDPDCPGEPPWNRAQ